MSDRAHRLARGLATALAGVRRELAGLPTVAAASALAVLGLAVRLPLILDQHAATPGGDSAAYLAIASSLAEGTAVPDRAYRTPGYPLIIVAIDALLPGGRIDNVVIAQHVLAVVFVAVVVVLVARWFDKATGILAGAMLALSPALPYLEHAVLSDFMFAIVAFAFAARLGRVVMRDRPSLPALASVGAIAAAAAYIRPSGQALLLAVIPAAFCATRQVRATLRASAVVAAVFALLVAPWVIRNAVKFDRPSMSVVVGDTLFVRAFEVDGLAIPTDRRSGQVVAELAAKRGDVRMVTAVTVGLQEAGLTRLQALEAQQSLAQEAIWNNPWKFAVGTVEQIDRLRVDPREADLGSDIGTHIPQVPRLTATVWDASNALSFVWWTLSLGTFAGLLVFVSRRRETRVVGAAFVFTWLAVAAATAAGRGALVRYELEIAPIAFVLGAFGAVFVVRSIGGAAGGWSRRRAAEDVAASLPERTGGPP